jgi:hypothetical protein
MNAFFEHHQDNIKFRYHCFDRLLLHGCIQAFLDGARAHGLFLGVSQDLSGEPESLAGGGAPVSQLGRAQRSV